ncbi:CCA tRNA nucleotidyltransferase [Bartonella sp. W8152]|nr:CCA tRNA nucleotidyltransferase [Bartonella sp. W8167]MBI0175298.1 CCA tRNA nucleotidyltransferase [Bartonella apis]
MGCDGCNDSFARRKVIPVTTLNIAKKALWLHDEGLQKLLHCLSENGEEARVVGGAVRNQLLGYPVNDIDIATTCVPDEIIKRASENGFKAVPTGYEHGTITVVVKDHSYEVTALRADIEPDGRRAKVIFGRDWKTDAKRRDFTINAIYADANGKIYDDVNGLADIETETLRFIGTAEERIREDYLRILRFFRLYAWVGKGRPDAEAIKACARLKDGLLQLSAERVWSEVKKMLSAPDPTRALLWMRQAAILGIILPETEKWGIDAFRPLIETERVMRLPPDPLLRLFSIVPRDEVRLKKMAERLRFSKLEKTRLMDFARISPIKYNSSDIEIKKLVYHHGKQAVLDELTLALSNARAHALSNDNALVEASHYTRLRKLTEQYDIPVFPLTGKDLLPLGITEGPAIGHKLKALEKRWVESGFLLDRKALLDLATA